MSTMTTVCIILVCFFIILLAVLWFQGKKEIVKSIILDIVIKAEDYWGSETGKIKFAEVMSVIYPRLPWMFKIFVNSNLLTKWINEAAEYIKNGLLKNGKTIEDTLIDKANANVIINTIE